ncbi:MAG: hypothetical protein KJZ80_09525 [Hyphomicrobiaceae bacterium]|nr:hypothetical protein [Hyphomicrobiaceae bacterium]
MAITWDPSDVPAVAAENIAAPMRRLIAESRGLVLLRGMTPEDAALVEASLRQRLGKEPSRELAALMRFRALVDVFASRRLRELMLERGHEVIAPALQTAAQLRLNLKWGFNPQRFTRALTALLDAGDVGTYIVTRELMDAA